MVFMQLLHDILKLLNCSMETTVARDIPPTSAEGTRLNTTTLVELPDGARTNRNNRNGTQIIQQRTPPSPYYNSFASAKQSANCDRQIINVAAKKPENNNNNKSDSSSSCGNNNKKYVSYNRQPVTSTSPVYKNKLSHIYATTKSNNIANRKTTNQKVNSYLGGSDSTAANQERALRLFNQGNHTTDQSPPLKDNNKFSRYTPLPAINSAGDSTVDNNKRKKSPPLAYEGGRLPPKKHELKQRPARKLIRQLTYKVMNPLYVKGPADLNCQQSGLQRPLSQSSTAPRFGFRQPTSVSIQHYHQNKTYYSRIINKHNIDDNLTNKNNHKPISKQKFSKDVHGKRIVVTKTLLEATERIESNKGNDVDTAFWIQF